MWKIIFLDYSYENILPETVHELNITMSMEGFGDDVSINTYLPLSSNRQSIYDESQESVNFGYTASSDANGKLVTWESDQLNGRHNIRYSFRVMSEAVAYDIPDDLPWQQEYHPSITPYLDPTSTIQSNHPRIIERCGNILSDDELPLKETIQKLFDDVNALPSRPFKGLTDALTTLKLGEASCNGKSRLLIAMCRNQGIPSRLVGGLILEPGTKKTSHQWIEIYLGGQWVPFDALNGHFGFIPSNYLELYRGDQFLFSHTANIGFDYSFNVKKKLVSNPKLGEELSASPLNSYLMWSAFEKAGIPLGLLKIILLLPLGAIVVAIARNVIGFKTFGVFLPALIAVSMSYTGLWWGMAAFLIVIMVVSVIHFPLERLGILYTPKLVIMLVSVVITFIALSIIGIKLDYTDLAYITLFPVVVITITAERFARTIMEEGFGKALKITFQTLIVVVMAFLAMNSNTMEGIFLAFPEVFFIIIGLMLILGRWMGLRLSEYARFKGFIG
ncbi:MAG: transglutaminase [Flavobacteriales bacterium]|nr:transglutaminase [Flavobacteriales bacterium]